MRIFTFNKTSVLTATSQNKHVFISIAGLGEKHPVLIENEFCCGILRQQFKFIGTRQAQTRILPGAFSHDLAMQIKTFVDDMNPEEIIVNCKAGQHRSPAIMAALYEYYEESELAKKVFQDFKPDMYVYDVLSSVLQTKTEK